MALAVARAIEKIDAFVVGGQAVNFWAEVYAANAPELDRYGPFTSKDVDFFGFAQAARRLADELNGIVRFPDLENETPNSTIVTANIDGHAVTIDFLRNILGVSAERQSDYCTLTVELDETEAGDGPTTFTIDVMHPVNCIISRVNSIMHPAIARNDEFTIRQLHASYYIFREYLRDMLSRGRTRNVHQGLSRLAHFLCSDPRGIECHRRTPVDFLRAFYEIGAAGEMHAIYREKTLAGMINRIERKRSRLRPLG